jgi:ketosteroid isomerase-like protein
MSKPASWRMTVAAMALAWLGGCAQPPQQFSSGDAARAQVDATERAFAKTMADRDFAGFQRHLSAETIFYSGPTPLRGRAQVAEWWQRYYKDAAAPFSWAPDSVEVLDSGRLALSTGPVHDPSGRLIGRFVSIWRQEEPGVWRIVFDRGESATPAQ